MSQLDPWFEQLANLPDMEHVHNLFSNKTEAGRIRLANLRRYFEIAVRNERSILLVGEAPGYQGTYRTGVPFTSESLLVGPKNKFGLFGGVENGFELAMPSEKIWKEPSATIVQRTLDELPILPLIWATFPLHPHLPGKELSNRAPTAVEIAIGAKLLRDLMALIEPQTVVAVGNVADKALKMLGISAEKVRHPSHGGATLFREQLVRLLTP